VQGLPGWLLVHGLDGQQVHTSQLAGVLLLPCNYNWNWRCANRSQGQDSVPRRDNQLCRRLAEHR
jgi:hypothetical protein